MGVVLGRQQWVSTNTRITNTRSWGMGGSKLVNLFIDLGDRIFGERDWVGRGKRYGAGLWCRGGWNMASCGPGGGRVGEISKGTKWMKNGENLEEFCIRVF